MLVNYNKISNKEYNSTKSIISKVKKDYKWQANQNMKTSINSYIKNLII